MFFFLVSTLFFLGAALTGSVLPMLVGMLNLAAGLATTYRDGDDK